MKKCPICKRNTNPPKAVKSPYRAKAGWVVWHFCKNGMSIFHGGFKSKTEAIKFWDEWAT